MQATQRAAVLINVLNDAAKGAEFLLWPDDKNVFSDRVRLQDGMVDHQPSVYLQEGLVLAHARAFASGNDESGDVLHAKLISHIPQVFIGICAERGCGKLANLNSPKRDVT